MKPVTIDGFPASAAFSAHVEACHAKTRLHGNCPPCTSSMYAGMVHAATCPSRAVAAALFGAVGLAS